MDKVLEKEQKIFNKNVVLESCFDFPLVDLVFQNEKYSQVYCPEPEVSLPKIGVSESLLSGAEQYFEKFQQYSYIYGLVKKELDALNYEPQGLAIDFGSGFGNTVIPILENYKALNVLASDISPDLLGILRREARKRGLEKRCFTVAMDAQRDYFKPEIADITFGCAVLHHMADPDKVIRTALKVLRPGGCAIFLEPFELGCSILRLAYLDILREAKERKESGPGFNFLEALNMDIFVRTHRNRLDGWEEKWFHLDDKWLFSRSYFEKIGEEMGVQDVKIRLLHDPKNMFSFQTKIALSSYGGLKEDTLPPWAWNILDRYDNEHFSIEQKSELIIEGVIVITK